MAIKVAILDDYQHAARAMADWSVLPAGVELTVFSDHLEEPDALAARLRPFEVLCLMRERTAFPGALLERLPALRLLITTGRRSNTIDETAARGRDVALYWTGPTGGRGQDSVSVAEVPWMLMLMLARHGFDEVAAVRAGRWQTAVGRRLAERTLGIVGHGRIGRKMAQIARAFEMEVLVFSRSLAEAEALAAGVGKVGLDDLLRRSDFVSLHYQLTPGTRGMIGAREIGLMRPTAYLVNTARGPLVDEAALVAALRERRIAGAGLDCFDVEPLPLDHPFRHLPNVVATPHIGFVTQEAYGEYFRGTVEAVAAYAGGGLAALPVRRGSVLLPTGEVRDSVAP